MQHEKSGLSVNNHALILKHPGIKENGKNVVIKASWQAVRVMVGADRQKGIDTLLSVGKVFDIRFRLGCAPCNKASETFSGMGRQALFRRRLCS
jgi:hypothetical protein